VKRVIAILGGSTPFTAALVEAFRASPACELRLFGQDRDALERMKRYAERRLECTVLATSRLEEAVTGAAVVVNQIRFGGLEGRSRDEALANRFGLAADETLGPCGLSAALRVVPRIRELAAGLGRRCPDAWVLNLSNPLSVTTRAMIRAGAPRKCVVLCELPLTTFLETCRLLRVSPSDVEWDYAGLNHRGFIFMLRHRDEDLMPRLPEMLDGRTIFGIKAEDIREVGALPLKYFRLSPSVGRAKFLDELKKALAGELEAGTTPPPSLSLRDQSWYEADDGRRMIVNCLRDDGLVREVPARVWRDRVEVVAAEPPARLAPWLERWASHERALLDALESPSLERIEGALALDPMVPQARASEIAQAIWAEHAN